MVLAESMDLHKHVVAMLLPYGGKIALLRTTGRIYEEVLSKYQTLC
jgi:hypothetical protein